MKTPALFCLLVLAIVLITLPQSDAKLPSLPKAAALKPIADAEILGTDDLAKTLSMTGGEEA